MSVKCGYCRQRHETIDEVRNCPERKPRVTPATLRSDRVGPPQWTGDNGVIHGTPPSRDSIYTVVFQRFQEHSTDDRITVRFYTPHTGRFAGTTLVKYLFGPNNIDDYTAFGNVIDGGVRIWVKYRSNERLKAAVQFLLNCDQHLLEHAGKTYALESGNCYVCGRTLTDPTSIRLGIGPVCRGDQ